MTNLVPQTMQEWMRTMERRYQDVATRRQTVSMLNVNSPTWRSTLAGTLATTSGTHYFMEFSVEGSAPEHAPGDPAFLDYQLVGSDPRYIATQDGLYLVRASIQWAGGGVASSRKVHILKGSSTTPLYSTEHAAPSGTGVLQECIGQVALLAGEYFRIGSYQTSGGVLNILSDSQPVTTSGGRGPSCLTVVPVGAYPA